MKVEPKVPMETQKTNGRREEEKGRTVGCGGNVLPVHCILR